MTADEIGGVLLRADDCLIGAQRHAIAGRWLPALEQINALHLLLVEATAELAQEAFNDGATKTAIAAALGVTPSTFRGMTKTRLG